MTIGSFDIEHLSEGQFDLFRDGSLQKNTTSTKKKQKKALLPDFYNELFVPVGIDPILVQGNGSVILLDTGLGFGLDSKKRDPNKSNIVTNLEVFGLHPDQVTHVVLTHLHSDHTGGLAHADTQSRITSTLPNARIYVQRAEWEFAVASVNEQVRTSDAPYELDNLYRLVTNGQFEFVDDETFEVVPGLEMIRTGGHTPGHSIVRIRDGGKAAYYFGDLIPNEDYLNFNMVPDADYEVTESRQIKMLLMKQAFLDDAEILFYHSVHLKSGKLTRDPNRQYILTQRS
jgi:glyoxylase-like metal-dependent hydrolase (beta-lactamase superfamily II)